MSKTKKGYWGIFFSPSLIKTSLPGFKDIKTPHITFELGNLAPDKLVGKETSVRVIGYGHNDKNEGYLVEIPDDLKPYYKGAENPHIAIAVAEGGKPVDTAKLDFSLYPEHKRFALDGVVDSFTFDKSKTKEKPENDKFDSAKRFVKLVEIRSFYRRLFEIKAMKEKIRNGESFDADTIEQMWVEERDRKNINDLGYNELKGRIVDTLLNNNISFGETKDAYLEKANPRNDKKTQLEMLMEIESDVKKEAFEEAKSGNWNTINDKYLTDSQREVVQMEEEKDDDGIDF